MPLAARSTRYESMKKKTMMYSSPWANIFLLMAMKMACAQDGPMKDSQDDSEQCCPSVLEMVTKKGGRTPTGLYVELYEDGDNQQRLYELSCRPGVADQPCRFVDASLYEDSRCIQKYSYSYALVRYVQPEDTPQFRIDGNFSVGDSSGWSLDYVAVRAGCECQVQPPRKARR